MGVYNPLVGIPESCAECFTRGWSNCFLHQQMSYPNVLHSRHPDCPLVEVKAPHGRLGDLDALRARMYHEAFETDSDMQKWESGCWIRYKMFERMEEAAPTVLEAEGKDDG